MDCNPPVSSVHGISQARIMEWVAISFGCVDNNKLWKILEEMRLSDHLTYLLRNLYDACKGATIRTGHGTTAAAAKSLQSCLTPSDPMDWSLPGSFIHGIFQARVLEWGAIAFSENIIYWPIKAVNEDFRSFTHINIHTAVVQSLSHVQLFLTPWIIAYQAPLSFTISWGLLNFMSIKSVMISNYLIHCHPLLLLPSIFQNSKKMHKAEIKALILSVQFNSVSQSCLTLCDPMECSTPGFPVHHQLPELAQTHVHQVSDAIQPSHPLLSPSSPAFNLSQHQGLSQWVSFLHQRRARP